MDNLKYTAQECKDIRGLPPHWYDFDTLAITYGIGHTDAMFIAAASPDAILKLLATNEQWEVDCREEVIMRREAEAECDRLREALNQIASWSEGETVNSSFDEPGAAEVARQALEEAR